LIALVPLGADDEQHIPAVVSAMRKISIANNLMTFPGRDI
jgi:hypothetical protein